MSDVGITKTSCHRTGERFQLFTRQIEDRNDLLINRFFDERADLGIIHRLAYRIQPGLEGDRHQRRVRAVQNGHLAFFVGHDVIDNQHV